MSPIDILRKRLDANTREVADLNAEYELNRQERVTTENRLAALVAEAGEIRAAIKTLNISVPDDKYVAPVLDESDLDDEEVPAGDDPFNPPHLGRPR